MCDQQRPCYPSQSKGNLEFLHGAWDEVIQIVGASCRAATVCHCSEGFFGIVGGCVKHVVSCHLGVLKRCQFCPMNVAGVQHFIAGSELFELVFQLKLRPCVKYPSQHPSHWPTEPWLSSTAVVSWIWVVLF